MKNLTTSEAQTLAREITQELFTNGANDRAKRLVLTSENGRDLGGLCENAVVDRIADRLSGRNPRPSIKAKSKSKRERDEQYFLTLKGEAIIVVPQALSGQLIIIFKPTKQTIKVVENASKEGVYRRFCLIDGPKGKVPHISQTMMRIVDYQDGYRQNESLPVLMITTV